MDMKNERRQVFMIWTLALLIVILIGIIIGLFMVQVITKKEAAKRDTQLAIYIRDMEKLT